MAGRKVPPEPAGEPAAGHHAGMRFAPGIVHAVHPEHGGVVTYTPGQLLPDWLREELAAGAALVPEADGVLMLGPVPGRHAPRKETT